MARMSIRSIRYRRPENPTWDLALERTIIVDRAAHPGVWAWAEIFGREAPVEIEIGFGKGRFLIAAAARCPERNWLGIEYSPSCAALAAERSAKHGIANVRIVRAAAEEVVAAHVADASVAAFHVYFPDPWPKKRHHKRRLVQPPFLREVVRALVPGGALNVATDHAEYFSAMLPVIAAAGFVPAELPGELEDEIFRTNYAVKWQDQGKPIYRARFQKY